MATTAVDPAHRFSAYRRLYAALSPEEGETAWQEAHRFDRLTNEQKQPGHWYRFEGQTGLIEVQADRSGEWHADGKLPDDVDPASVIEIPAGAPVPSLLDEMVAILSAVPDTAPNHAEIQETITYLKDLPTPDRAARLVKSFQKTLATVPATAEDQIRFLQQASQQMVGKELLAGKACGRDVSGVLMIAAIAEAVAAMDPSTCVKMIVKSAGLEVGSCDELGSHFIEDCFWRGMQDQLVTGLDSLRSQGESIIRSARQGLYPEGHPELVLDIYYGGLLQAVPYLLAAEEGFHKQMLAPNLSNDDRDTFAHKAETTEEKLVRMNEALLYAAQDVDLSQLRRSQAEVRWLLQKDAAQAKARVHEIIDLEFFYPPNFESVLLGEDSSTS